MTTLTLATPSWFYGVGHKRPYFVKAKTKLSGDSV